MARQRQDKYQEILDQLQNIKQSILGVGSFPPSSQALPYSRDFMYFIVSMFIPLGYGEVNLIHPDSIWHPIVGWICWGIPVVLFSHMLWKWLGRKLSVHEKLLVACKAIPILIVLGFIGGAYLAIDSFLSRQKEAEQGEVFKNLSPHVLPGLSDNPMESVFSITNGSDRTTIGSGTFYCAINQLLGWSGSGMPLKISGLSSKAFPNEARLLPGDSRSEPCLTAWNTMVQHTVCLDMELWLQYTIDPQPKITKEKKFRMIGIQSREGVFNWYPEPIQSQVDYCDYFKKQYPSH